jgi:uncharacterized protein (DUF58 family)
VTNTGPATPVVLRPTGRAFALLFVLGALGALGQIAGSKGLVPLDAAVAVPLVLSPLFAWARARRAAGGVHARALVAPPLVPVGDGSTLEVTVVNTSPGRVSAVGMERPTGRWRRLGHVPALTGDGADLWGATTFSGWVRRRCAPSPLDLVRLPALDTGGSTSIDLPVPTDRRAMLALPPLCVWIHDPFGLFGAVVARTSSVVAVVYPRRAENLDVTLSVGSAPTTTATYSSESHSTATDMGGEFADLRPYVPGDRLHLLHWPALARHGALLVRQFDPDTGSIVSIVLDDRMGVHRRGAFEDVLSTILTLIENAAARELPVELMTLSGLRATVAPTPGGVATVLPLLATLEPRRAPRTLSAAWVLGDGMDRPMMVTTVTGADRLPAFWRQRAQVVAR